MQFFAGKIAKLLSAEFYDIFNFEITSIETLFKSDSFLFDKTAVPAVNRSLEMLSTISIQ